MQVRALDSGAVGTGEHQELRARGSLGGGHCLWGMQRAGGHPGQHPEADVEGGEETV